MRGKENKRGQKRGSCHNLIDGPIIKGKEKQVNDDANSFWKKFQDIFHHNSLFTLPQWFPTFFFSRTTKQNSLVVSSENAIDVIIIKKFCLTQMNVWSTSWDFLRTSVWELPQSLPDVIQLSF